MGTSTVPVRLYRHTFVPYTESRPSCGRLGARRGSQRLRLSVWKLFRGVRASGGGVNGARRRYDIDMLRHQVAMNTAAVGHE